MDYMKRSTPLDSDPVGQRDGDNELELPTLHRFLRGRRKRRDLTQEELAAVAKVSVSWIQQLEKPSCTAGSAASRRGKRLRTPKRPSKDVLEALVRALRLDEDERCHLYDLAGFAGHSRPDHIAPLADVNDVQLSPMLLEELDELEPEPVGYLDMSWKLLACNDSYRALFPGQREGRSVLDWQFSSEAKHVVLSWHSEAEALVYRWRGAMGVYRDAPWAQPMLRQLSCHPEFREFWANEKVAFGRAEPALHLRDYDTGQALTLDVEQLPICTPHPILRFRGKRRKYTGPSSLLRTYQSGSIAS